jgi:hypothetical protein
MRFLEPIPGYESWTVNTRRGSMENRNTLARTIHDLGLATWLGGSLMGAVGLNAAAAEVTEPTERLRVANAGWARWTPVNAAGIAAYVLGGAVLTGANKGRVTAQKGVARATLAKTLLTGVTLAATGYSRVLGQRLIEQGKAPVEDGTTPTFETPSEVSSVQRQLKILQYAIPAHVAGLVTLSALMGEQQRPMQVLGGIVRRLIPGA